MKVQNKETKQIVEATKNEDGSYKVGDKTYGKEDMSKLFTPIKESRPKEDDVQSNTEQHEPTIGGDNIPALFEALAKCQGQMELATKDVEGYGYSYSNLAQIIKLAKEPLSSNGLALTQFPSTYIVDNVTVVRVTSILTHKDGGYIKGSFDCIVTANKKQAFIMSVATIVSYMSRYMRNNILGIASEDDEKKL